LSASLLSAKIGLYGTIILPLVLYGCGSWYLALRREQRLAVFENRALRTFGPTKDEIIGGWRKLHNEELHNLYSSPSIIRIIKSIRMRGAGHVARMEQNRMYAKFSYENLKERDHLQNLNVDERIKLEQGFGGKAGRKETAMKTWT
jgi:hypothetical protein